MSLENLSPARKLLMDYVDGLALFEGGNTRDVIRSGGMELWPGRLLVAEVLNADPGFTNPDYVAEDGFTYPIYSLTVYDICGDEVEVLAISPDDGRVDTCFDGSELFNDHPLGAPDYMIESFFVRYWLNEQGLETT